MKTLSSRNQFTLIEQPSFSGTMQLQLNFYKHDRHTIYSMLEISKYFLHFIQNYN